MSCPTCTRNDVGTIRFARIASGVSFYYCRHCEHRWWARQSEDVKLGDVLQAATVLARAS